MDLDAIITHLRPNVPLLGGRVAGAAELEKFDDNSNMVLPYAFVVPHNDDVAGNQTQNALVQVVTEQFGVVVVFDNAGDRRGQSVTRLYDPMRTELWAALLNWRLDPVRASRGLEYAGGQQYRQPTRAHLTYIWLFSQDITITDAMGWQVPSAPLLEIDMRFRLQPGADVVEADLVLPQP